MAMNRFMTRSVDEHVLRPLRRSGLVFVCLALVGLAGTLVGLVIRFWRTSITLSAVGYLLVSSGPESLLQLVVLVVVVLAVWAWIWRESFFGLLVPAVRAWWVRWFRYGYRWAHLAHRHRLEVIDTRGGHDTTPVVDRAEIVRVEATKHLDRLLVSIPTGLSEDAFTQAAPALAHATKALSCRVRADRPGRVWIELHRKDALRKPVPALPVPEQVHLDAIPLGIREDGTPWTLPVRGTHVLVVGSTGAGKASVLHSLMRGAAPSIRAGLIEPWGFDPKGGMELAIAKPLFARLCTGTPESMADALEECADLVTARGEHLAGITRSHAASVEMPLRLVLIDELATLTAFCERRTAHRIDKALGSILTKGRAVGVIVVAFLQDPGKDVIAYRNLFPTRIALRVGEAVEVDMVLKEGARDRGALADQIPRALPGVGFVRDDGDPDPIRVRAAYCTDDDIRTLAATHAYATAATALPAQRSNVVELRKHTGEATA